jgi:hypothetical protein
MTSLSDNDYPDTNSSLIQNSIPLVMNQTYQYSQITNNTPNSGFNPKNPYQISIPSNFTTNQVGLNTGQILNNINIPTTCNLWGYRKPISSEFCRGTK